MQLQNLRNDDRTIEEPRCAVCGAPVRAGNVCPTCRRERMTPQRYAELFWDEA